MKPQNKFIPLILLLAVLITSCQPQQISTNAIASPTQQIRTVKPAATLIPTKVSMPTPTATQPSAAAVETTNRYFTALQKADYDAASKLLSNFSLLVFNTTREDARVQLQTSAEQDGTFKEFKIKDSRLENEKTVLVQVEYTQGDNQKQEEWIPLRAEGNEWRVNLNNVIETKDITTPEISISTVTIRLNQWIRATTYLRLTFLVQNRWNEVLSWGLRETKLAAFSFGDTKVDVESARVLFSPRKTSDGFIDLKGSYEKYPTKVDLYAWRSQTFGPWSYSFDLANQ